MDEAKQITKEFNDQLESAMQTAVKQLTSYLDERFTEEINEDKWRYLTPPKLRDIVDEGALRRSQHHSQPDPLTVEFRWRVTYATNVHDGGVTPEGERFLGRPWTTEPLKEADKKAQSLFDAALEGEQQ